MRHGLVTALWLWSLLLGGAAAQADTVTQRMVSDDQAATWAAVGPLHVAGNRSCTATLITPTEAITAAHCLFHPVTGHRASAADIRFVPGLRRDTYAALRRVTATAILPGFAYDGPEGDLPSISQDIALLQLDEPVLPSQARPLTVTAWPAQGLAVDIVGYGQDRPLIASIRAGCPVKGRDGALVLLGCAGVPGLSGAPVTLATSPPQLVGVVSAVVGTRVRNDEILVVTIAPLLATLRASLTP